MNPRILPNERMVQLCDDVEAIIDMATTIAGSDPLTALHLQAHRNAVELQDYHECAAIRYGTHGATEVTAFHLTRAAAAEALAYFHIHLLDLHLDQTIRNTAKLSDLQP